MSVVVVYHSGYGHTEKQAQAVAAGANAALVKIDENGELSEEQWQSLDAAKAIVFGSPTYMGMVSWQFKKFADASSKRWFAMDWKDKFAAGFTNSASMNGDKGVTISYLITLAMQHGMVWIGTGLMPANTKAAQRDDVNYLGGFSGLLSQSPADASPDEAPGVGDLETAKIFGERVASFVK
ncbi:flavodoxin family protein [Vibrio taketomensis]|uniref:flavodoxin family protein n=1 Tax=Vibrio taketomensis TaxID=2572923 RepID=UPI001E3FBE8D|nr:flavodoxin family protein [Vibrio taketomensis]